MKVLKFFLIFLTGALSGGVLGAITNMLNGLVSPFFFYIVLGWQNFDTIWEKAVYQGAYEGMIYGVVYSLIFCISLAIITKGKAKYKFALVQILKLFAITIGFWILGGLGGVLVAKINPEMFQEYEYIPSLDSVLIKFGWVRGSIRGAVAGGFFSILILTPLIKKNWDTALSLEKAVGEFAEEIK